jgi:hypothetical protein
LEGWDPSGKIFFAIHSFTSGLPTKNKSEKDRDQSYNKKKMNDPPCLIAKKTDGPNYDQNTGDQVKYISHNEIHSLLSHSLRINFKKTISVPGIGRDFIRVSGYN